MNVHNIPAKNTQITNHKRDRRISKSTPVILVNLISKSFLSRFQAPLAINLLKGYLEAKLPDVEVQTIDMQNYFDRFNSGKTSNCSRSLEQSIQTIATTIMDHVEENGKVIVGLSMKWDTQEVANEIVSRIYRSVSSDKILFVLGNIIPTFGFTQLLNQELFKKSLVVIGEGEDALLNIVCRTNDGPFELKDYLDIPNVVLKLNDELILPEVARVDLQNYPSGTIKNAKDIYDPEMNVYAYETSRGCTWGSCTFCSIKHQFGGVISKTEKVWGWYAFPIEKVLDDITRLAQQGARVVDIKDSEFFGSVRVKHGKDYFFETMERVDAFAKGLIEINKRLKEKIIINHISVRVDTIFRSGEPEKNKRRREIYKLLKKAGLRGIYLGIESGSPSQFKRYCKGSTVEENRKAIEIIRDIGLDLEVGFIFFDPLTTLDEIAENMAFIEDSKLHETPSRLFGSLRIQSCAPYYKIANRKNLIGDKDPSTLTFACKFRNQDVAIMEKAFLVWENATRKLIRLLPQNCSREVRLGDFHYMKDLLSVFQNGSLDIRAVGEAHGEMRKILLNNFIKRFGNDGLIGEYLMESVKLNQAFIVSNLRHDQMSLKMNSHYANFQFVQV